LKGRLNCQQNYEYGNKKMLLENHEIMNL